MKQILLTEDEIKQKVKALGKQVTIDYKGKDIFVIGVLKGSIVFLADLIREVELPVQFDFMAVSSYGSSTQSTGAVKILKDLDASIEGKHVLIVEDIIDTGLTLKYLIKNLASRKPESIKVCTLLNKPSRRKVDLKVDYNGFDIPDEFVVGYGLDYAEKYRNFSHIGVLKPEIYQ